MFSVLHALRHIRQGEISDVRKNKAARHPNIKVSGFRTSRLQLDPRECRRVIACKCIRQSVAKICKSDMYTPNCLHFQRHRGRRCEPLFIGLQRVVNSKRRFKKLVCNFIMFIINNGFFRTNYLFIIIFYYTVLKHD